ncbi:MAG: hypothetical protein ACOCP8_07270 [archaeon]
MEHKKYNTLIEKQYQIFFNIFCLPEKLLKTNNQNRTFDGTKLNRNLKSKKIFKASINKDANHD